MWFCLLCSPNAAKTVSSESLHFSLLTRDKWGDLWWCLHVRHVPGGAGTLWNVLIAKSQIVSGQVEVRHEKMVWCCLQCRILLQRAG